jgi:hypothetical protein
MIYAARFAPVRSGIGAFSFLSEPLKARTLLPGQSAKRINARFVFGVPSLTQAIRIECPETLAMKPSFGDLHSKALPQRLKFLCRCRFNCPSVLVSGFKGVRKAEQNFVENLILCLSMCPVASVL